MLAVIAAFYSRMIRTPNANALTFKDGSWMAPWIKTELERCQSFSFLQLLSFMKILFRFFPNLIVGIGSLLVPLPHTLPPAISTFPVSRIQTFPHHLQLRLLILLSLSLPYAVPFSFALSISFPVLFGQRMMSYRTQGRISVRSNVQANIHPPCPPRGPALRAPAP